MEVVDRVKYSCMLCANCGEPVYVLGTKEDYPTDSRCSEGACGRCIQNLSQEDKKKALDFWRS